MTSTDVCDIIKACGDSGVTSLEFDGLSLSFVNRQMLPFVTTNVDSERTVPYTIDTATPSDDIPEEEEEDIDVDELMFTDPEAWDEYARNGE